MTDATLLQLYATRRDAEAFAQLVDRYQQMVLATCRRTLHQASDLDDAVQETFLRLVQNAGAPHSNLAGWLYRCAANVSSDLNRRRATRARHEAAASFGAEPTDDAQRTLAELREHLDAALAKLDPEQMDLIVHRYFLGRQQTELATERGLSQATISTRLEKAVQAVREQLKLMGCVTIAAGTAAAVATLLETESASAAVPAALTANLMKIGLTGAPAAAAGVSLFWILSGVMGIAAATAIALGIWAALPKPPPPTQIALATPVTQPAQVTPPPAAPAADSPAVTIGPEHGPSGAAAPVWQSAQPSPTAVLTGQIRDSDGRPVANATVTLYGPPRSQVAQTDAQGIYAFASIPRAADLRLGVAANGFVTVEPNLSNDPALQLTPTSHARRDVVLTHGIVLVVTVADADGKPLPGAFVDALPVGVDSRLAALGRKKTDGAGRASFTLAAIPAGYDVTASTDGLAPAHAMVNFGRGDAAQSAILTLKPGIAVKGLAVCSDGKPAAGWKIYYSPAWWKPGQLPTPAAINDDGAFTLTNVTPGEYKLMIETGSVGYPLANAMLPPPAEPLRLDLPVASPSSQTQLTGRVRFIGTSNPAVMQVSVNALPLSGGRGMYLATINPAPPPRRGAGANLPANERTYNIPLIPPGSYRLTFQGTRIETKVIPKVTIPGDIPLVELQIAGKLHMAGTVADAATGQPVTHFALRLRKLVTYGGSNFVQDGHWKQVDDPLGKFSVELVGPGVYQAQISLDGYAWIWSDSVLVEKGTGQIDFKVTPGGSLTGVVLDPAGKPIEAAKIVPLSMAQCTDSGFADHFDGEAGAVLTDAQGRFTLPHLAAGNETLRVLADNYVRLNVPDMKIVDGQTTDAGTLTVHIGGAVEGTIYDNDGKPVSGQTIDFNDTRNFTYQNESLNRLAQATTDAAGNFHVDHLPGETLYATFSMREFPNHKGIDRRAFHPVDGKTTRLDFNGPTPLVSGRILAGGAPSANRRVVVCADAYDGPISAINVTDADGRFTYHGFPPGQYNLYVQPTTRGERIDLGPVQITGQPQDLGDFSADTGPLTVSVGADNPEILAAIRLVSIGIGNRSQRIPLPVGRAVQDDPPTAVWHADNIPPGVTRVGILVGTEPPVSYSQWFDRKSADLAAPLEFHIPRASATLIISNAPGNTGGARLERDDGAVEIAVSAAPDWTGTFHLPPGVYRVEDISSVFAYRADVPPIVLNDGETKTVALSVPAATGQIPRLATIRPWTADGILITDATIHLLDNAGKPLPPVFPFGIGEAFLAVPGHYTLISEVPGQAPMKTEIDVPPVQADQPTVGRLIDSLRLYPIDLFMN
jgi:RNA polymerase sigma-70 factor (ECF subfamily)